MGKKIDSIKEMHQLGIPAPKCVFIMEEDDIDSKIEEYFKLFPNSEYYTIRTDTNNSSMSCKRLLTATRTEVKLLSHEWNSEGFQIILQEFIDERNEIKSGNIYLKSSETIIEGANAPHHIFTNGKALDVNIILPRYDSYSYELHKFFKEQTCFSFSEITRLIRISHKIPYNNTVAEFSFFKNGNIYFWELKKER